MMTLKMQRRVLICGASCLALSATAAWAQSSEPEPIQTVEELVESLMGRKPEARFRFIQENAEFAGELDI